MDLSAVGLMTLVSAGPIDVRGLWHPEVWGQVPAGAGVRCLHGLAGSLVATFKAERAHAAWAVTAPMTQIALVWYRQVGAWICPGEARRSIAPRCVFLYQMSSEDADFYLSAVRVCMQVCTRSRIFTLPTHSQRL